MSLDLDQIELGTHTYRCKGCNGKYCKQCLFGDMWESDKQKTTDYVKKVTFANNKAPLFTANNTLELSHKIGIMIIDDTEKAFYNAVIKYAEDNGYSELYLIDEEFIRSAIENEIKRRTKNDTL